MGSFSGGSIEFPQQPSSRKVGGARPANNPSPLFSPERSSASSARADSVDLRSASETREVLSRSVFFEVNKKATRAILTTFSGKASSDGLQFNFKSIEVYSRTSAGTEAESAGEGEGIDPLAQLREYFSPENTSQRIFDFAVSRYGQGDFAGPDSSENRARYRDFIFPAIEQGFQEATSLFGELPKEIMDQLRETLAQIQTSFENFIAGSPDNAASSELATMTAPGASPATQ